MKHNRPTVADLAAYDEIIDVRSPAEFADDHIPGAINCPVLDDAQRAQVGTIYKQVSPFEAKKIGAALVSENIARHLKERFLDRPKTWKPLIYCWRGGERSGSMTTIFRAIGWPAGQLDGGYKNYRRHVIDQLGLLPGQFNFRVVCGPTGSAKTRILQALAALGEQVLDLETLACHKGSVLGVLPDQPQPSQKTFETLLWQALSAFDPSRPVYVEAESRKIGRMHVPEALIARIRSGECLEIDANVEARVEFLLDDYAYFFSQADLLISQLGHLRSFISHETLQRWQEMVHAKQWPDLVRELLELHYDPLYRRSQNSHFTGLQQRLVFASLSLCTAAVEDLAKQIVQSRAAQMA